MPPKHGTTGQHLISVNDFMTMKEADLFIDNPQVELINGVIYDRAMTGSVHGKVLDQAIEEVINSTGNQASVRVQSTIQLGNLSALRPDLSVLRRNSNHHSSAYPGATDTLLIMEVADSSLNHYYETKPQLYASHNIPEFWLVDIPNHRLTAFWDPDEDGYRCVLNMSDKDSISLCAEPGISIVTSRIMSAMLN